MLMIIFGIVVVLLTLGCVFFSVFVGYLTSDVFNGSCNNSTISFINAANDAFNNAQILCSSSDKGVCSCDLTDEAIKQGGYSSSQQDYLKSLNR
jgi:hypothetical protein